MKQRILLALFLLVCLVLLGETGYYFYLTRLKTEKLPLEEPTFTPTPAKDSTPIVLVNQHPRYLMEINPSFDLEQQRFLLAQYGKSKITFYLVDSEDQVPWDGATQRGGEIDGERNLKMNMMMAIYKDNTVDYYLYPYPENYQKFGERKLEVLSGVVSYKILEALASSDRGYLVEAKPAPRIPMEEIKKYAMDNPLVLVKER